MANKLFFIIISALCTISIALAGWGLNQIGEIRKDAAKTNERVAKVESILPKSYPPQEFRSEIDKRFELMNELINVKVAALSDKAGNIQSGVEENKQLNMKSLDIMNQHMLTHSKIP